MKRLLLLALVILLFSSCIGIESNVSFKKDGSGDIVFIYRISKMLTEMGGEDAETPLPVSEEALTASVADHPGLTLKKVSQREDDQDIFITAEIGFEAIEEFTGLEDFSAMPMRLEARGGDTVFTQIISEGTGSDGDSEDGSSGEGEMAEMQAMMQEFFLGYELIFVVNAPSPIKEHNLGELSGNGRSVTYVIPLLELTAMQQETVLSVVW